MKNLFKFEFRKLFRGASFYVCLGLTVLTALLFTLISYIANISIAELYGESLVLESNSAWFLIFGYGEIAYIFPIFGVIYFLADNTDSTIKNIFGHGVSRTMFYFVKLIILVIVATIFFLSTSLSLYLITAAVFNVWTTSTEEINLAINVFVYSYFYLLVICSFVVFTCSFIKKTGWAIVFALFVPTLLSSILSLIDLTISLETLEECNIESYFYVYYETYISNGTFEGVDSARMFFVLLGYLVGFTGFGWLISSNEQI